MLDLLWPWALLALPLPLFVLLLSKHSKTRGISLYWRHSQLMTHHARPEKSRQVTGSLLLALLAWTLLVLAIAQPTWLGEPTRVPPTGRDLLIALDLSVSMQNMDMVLNQQTADRLSAAKDVLKRFISERQGDRVGIIVFGSKAFLQAPLSYDLKSVNQLVQETQIGFAGENTAIGDAIGLGIKRLKDKPADKKVMILMTDGANTAGRVSPLQAAQFATKEGVTIHTIGIGAEQITIQGIFGPKTYHPSSDLDEALLTNIAEQTGGRFFRARSSEELHSIYHILDQLEPTPAKEILQRPKTSLFHWLGLAALLCMALSIISTGNVSLRLRGKA